jgi:hypothetical protein
MAYPVFGSIDGAVYNNIQSSGKAPLGGATDITQASSELVPWVRIISATDRLKTPKTKNDFGLILYSNPDVPMFADYGTFTTMPGGMLASGINQTPSAYGGKLSSGMLGVDFTGKAVYPYLTPWTGDLVSRPGPLVTAMEIKEGKDQISRHCTLTVKCFSLAQVEMLQEYLMEPGHTLFVEYGWNTDASSAELIDTSTPGTIISEATDVGLNYSLLHTKRVNAYGDYDAFYGFIVGGSLTSENDIFNLTVNLRGAPGLPVFLQGQHTIMELDGGTKQVKNIPTTQTYSINDINDDTAGTIVGKRMGGRRYKWMFNKLPGNRQTPEVKSIIDKVYSTDAYGWWDLLNFDYKISQDVANALADTFITSIKELFGQKEFSVGGMTVPKDKLVSENRYIRFGVALDILNANNGLWAYKMGTQSVTCRVNNYGLIGAFPNMFSTKPNKLVIPGNMPNFYEYYCNPVAVSIEDILTKNFIDNRIDGYALDTSTNKYVSTKLSFVQDVDIPGKLGASAYYNGFYEKAGYYGKLENLYINFNVFESALKNSSNKSMRDVLIQMCNEMSSAVNSFWNLQIIEMPIEDGIKLQIVDENWRGYLANKKSTVKEFFHSGEQSVFLEATLDIDIPQEMTNQIVLKREDYSSQPDSRGLDMGGLFGKSKDRFFDEVDYRKTLITSGAKKTAATPSRKPADVQAEIDVLLASLVKTTNTSGGLRGITYETDTYKDAAGNLVYTETRMNGIVRTNKYNNGISEADKLLDLRKELTKVSAETKTTAETALSTNLNKIDVIPNPITNIIVPMTLKPDAGFAAFNKNFKIYCCDDTQLFDIMKNNAFEAYNGIEKTSHPLPIKYTFKILGKSGLRRGDTFNIIGIPKKYRDFGFFQITQIEQTVEGNSWYTTVTGQYFQQIKST